MDEDYGGNYITIEDEDGQEFELEQLDTLEYNDSEYALFLPADMEEDDPDYGYIILRIEEHDGEEFYCSVDEEEELSLIHISSAAPTPAPLRPPRWAKSGSSG